MTAAANEDGGDSEKSRFRCLDAARYVVAAAVTVLILAVIVTAIKVVLRLDSLQISIHKGSITTSPVSPPEPEAAALSLELQLRAQNPSGRVRMYYLNITAYLFDNKTSASASTDPELDSVLFFKPKDMAVRQQEALDCPVHTNPPVKKKNMDPIYFDMLYNNGSRFISDMTLRLDGNLVTEVTSEFNRTRPTTYYCEQLLVGGNPNDDAFESSEDVVCKQQRSAAPP